MMNEAMMGRCDGEIVSIPVKPFDSSSFIAGKPTRSMAETISVQIHGTEYKLRGEDAARVREAADLVNEQMRFVAGKAPTQPTTTIAVLAALNTAELLKSEQERSARDAADIVRRINTISSSIRELIDFDSGDSSDVSLQSPAP